MKKVDIRIRKVKVLHGRAKEEAEKQGLKSDDLVILRTSLKRGSLPAYRVEKIEGDSVSFLSRYAKKLKEQHVREAEDVKRNQADQPDMWEYLNVDWSDVPDENPTGI